MLSQDGQPYAYKEKGNQSFSKITLFIYYMLTSLLGTILGTVLWRNIKAYNWFLPYRKGSIRFNPKWWIIRETTDIYFKERSLYGTWSIKFILAEESLWWILKTKISINGNRVVSAWKTSSLEGTTLTMS